MERKSFRAVNYKAKDDGDRVRTGIAAVFGNVDDGGDITHKGAFTKTLKEGRRRFNHYWNHDSSLGPIATILDVKEVGRKELPAEILEYAPDAEGGLMVKREYYPKEVYPLAEQILYAIDKGDLREMSYAYDAVKVGYSETDGKQTRHLRENILYDTSDVPLGMNPATIGSYKGLLTVPDVALQAFQLQAFYNEIKAGRRTSSNDAAMLERMREMIADLLGEQAAALETPPLDEETPKSKEAEAVSDTSLISTRAKLQLFELETLR